MWTENLSILFVLLTLFPSQFFLFRFLSLSGECISNCVTKCPMTALASIHSASQCFVLENTIQYLRFWNQVFIYFFVLVPISVKNETNSLMRWHGLHERSFSLFITHSHQFFIHLFDSFTDSFWKIPCKIPIMLYFISLSVAILLPKIKCKHLVYLTGKTMQMRNNAWIGCRSKYQVKCKLLDTEWRKDRNGFHTACVQFSFPIFTSTPPNRYIIGKFPVFTRAYRQERQRQWIEY